MNYAKAKLFWDGQRQKQKAMEVDELKKEIEKFIVSQRLCCMATGMGTYIRNTTLQYTFHDGYFWFLTEGGHKFEGLETNKNVCIAIHTSDRQDGKNIGLQVNGTAEIYESNSKEFENIISVRKITQESIEKLGHPVYVIRVLPVSYEILNAEFEERGYGRRQMLIEV